jgi:hypothetical protein
MKLQIDERKFRHLYFILPFAALVFSNLGFLIDTAKTMPAKPYFLFIAVHLLFLASLAEVTKKILIELSLEFFEDSKNSIQLKTIFSNKGTFPVKSSIFVAVFVGIYVYLSLGAWSLSYLKLFVMIIPSAALLLDSKYFLSGKIRFISGKYLCFDREKRGFCVMLSCFVNEENKIVFLAVDGTKIETDISVTDIDFCAFEEECRRNGLVLKKQK